MMILKPIVTTGSREIDKHMATIGRISDQTGVSVETIRYYEKKGLLPLPPRTAGGHRIYDVTSLARLQFIRRSRDLGFSLEDTRSLLAMADGGFSCKQVHSLTIGHLHDVQHKIRDLKRLEKTLKRVADECSQGNTPDCPVIEALSGSLNLERDC